MSPKPRVLTGTRPSGKPHFGNYFGAYKPIIELQSQFDDVFFFLADLHTLNGPDSPDDIRAQSLDITATMLACGYDPTKGLFYAQSGVPEVCELTWILGCQTPYGLMQRAHSFKDATAKGIEVNMGVFNYPILMAADILMYDATLVPVGKDQKQHLEMARDIAQRFNNRYGEVLTLPNALIQDDVAVVPGTDGEKMSKSKHNIVPIFATDKEWKKAVMSIVSDSKGLEEQKDPETCNVFSLLKLICEDKEKLGEVAESYRAGGYGYGHAKQELLFQIQQRFSTMRDKYADLISKPNDLREILASGSQKARIIASEKLEKVQQAVGVLGRQL